MRFCILGPATIASAALCLTGLLPTSCRAPEPPPPRDLADAARVIQEMMSPGKLEATGFYSTYPDPKPSDFVSYIDSEQGIVLWPPREDFPFADPLELEQSRSIGESVIPKGIAFRRNRPDPEGGRQVVYRADDSNGEVVIEAYTDPESDPVLTFRRRFPQ